MKHLARTLHALAALALVAAIWSPIGAWWQYLLTALLLFLIGAMVAAAQQTAQQQAPTGNSTGPHLHFTTEGLTPEEVAEKFDQHAARQTALRPDRPIYGKPNKENDQR